MRETRSDIFVWMTSSAGTSLVSVDLRAVPATPDRRRQGVAR